MTCHNNLDIQVLIAVVADDPFYFTFSLMRAFGPFRNTHEYARTAAGITGLIQGNVNIFMNPFVIGRDKTEVRLPIICADKSLIGTFENGNNGSFFTAVCGTLFSSAT